MCESLIIRIFELDEEKKERANLFLSNRNTIWKHASLKLSNYTLQRVGLFVFISWITHRLLD